jgi:diguanylate cyclase (GGDEF)-like protein/PAS domain S-box-containing protein
MISINTRMFLSGYVLSVLLCIILIASLWWQNRKRFPEIVLWLACFVMQFAGVLLITLRGILPDFFTIIIANILIIGGLVILYVGLCRHVGKECIQTHNYIMLALFGLVHMYLTYVYPDFNLRVVNLSIAFIFICAQCSWLLLRRAEPDLRPVTKVTGIIFGVLCFFSLVQITVNLTVTGIKDLLLSGLLGISAILTYQIAFIALSIVLFLMISHRLSLALESEIIQRKQDEKLMRLRLSLLEFAATHSLEEVLQKTVDEVGDLVDSPIGFYHFVENDQKTLSLQAWSTRTLKEFCKTEGRDMHYGIDQAGVWVDCVHKRQTVIHNDYNSLPHRKGMPQGHAPVIRELVVPIMRGGLIVAILGIGNKPVDYTQKDAEIVSYLADVAWEITLHKKAEEALKKSEEKFKQLAEAFPETIFEADMKGNITYANEHGLEHFGFTKEDIAGGVNIFDLISPDDRNLAQERIQNRIQGVNKKYLEYKALKKDGSVFYALGLSIPIMLNGAPVGIRGFVLDVTESKQAEEALRESEERYHFIADHTADQIWTMDLSMRFIYSSPAVVKTLGYTIDEFIALKIDRFFTPESLVMANKLLIEELETDKDPNADPDRIRTFHSEHYHKNGHLVWMESSLTFFRDASMKPIGILGVSRDITERKKTEEQIQHMATHDLLTDLPSLRLAKDRLSRALGIARRYKKATAVMFIDLDGFKAVNDTLGHDAGDYVLKQVAQRLLSCVRETDTVARVGGDEFLIIATEINSPENAAQIAEKVIHLVSQPIVFNEQETAVGTSIGIALFPEHGEDMDQLIKQADEAMYSVKNAGKNGFRFVSTEIK